MNTNKTTSESKNMSNKQSFRVRVMKYAWQLFRVTKEGWNICLRRAWVLYRLAKEMRKGMVTFYYKKVDGTIRRAEGTLQNLPFGTSLGKKGKTPSYKTMAYYDTAKGAFRCFKIENFVCYIG